MLKQSAQSYAVSPVGSSLHVGGDVRPLFLLVSPEMHTFAGLLRRRAPPTCAGRILPVGGCPRLPGRSPSVRCRLLQVEYCASACVAPRLPHMLNMVRLGFRFGALSIAAGSILRVGLCCTPVRVSLSQVEYCAVAGEGRLRASGSMGSERFPKRFGPEQPGGSLHALWNFGGCWAL